jgi:pericentrin
MQTDRLSIMVNWNRAAVAGSRPQPPHGCGQWDNLQPAKVLVTLKDSSLHRAESMMSVLTVCQRQLEAELLLVKNEMRLNMDSDKVAEAVQGKEKQLEDCQLWSVDLIAQVKQLQEKLNCLVYSMAFQDIHMEHLKFQQHSALPCQAENGSSDDSHNGKETDASPPVDTFNTDKATWDLSGVTKNQELMENEMPDFLTQEKLVLKDKPLSLQTSVHSSSFHIEEAEPQKDGVRALDLSSWSPPPRSSEKT